MNIAFLAHDKKKELMVQFCTAYKSILSKHSLFATATTGRLIADNTGLPITMLLSTSRAATSRSTPASPITRSIWCCSSPTPTPPIPTTTPT